MLFWVVAGGLCVAATHTEIYLYPSNKIDLIEARSATIPVNTRSLLIAGTLVHWLPPIIMALLPSQENPLRWQSSGVV